MSDNTLHTASASQTSSEKKMHWYVVQVHTTFEKNVLKVLQERIKSRGLEEKFGEIIVPTEEVVEMRDGKKRTSDRKFFPGYVLVQMICDEDAWHFVRETPKVSGFLGGKKGEPTPLRKEEVDRILNRIQEGGEKPKPKVLFEIGEVVRVAEGPFADFNGTVEEVMYEKSRLRVAVLIFGRSTPVELEFSQVEKV